MHEGIRSSKRATAIAGAALSASLGVGCNHDPSRTTPADAAGDASIVTPGSAFTIVQSRSTYVATSTSDPRFAVEMDCDDETTDGRYFGVAPVIDGKRLQISMYGGPTFPIFTPDFDAGAIRCTRIESDDARLIVGLDAGTYKALDPAGPDVPVPLEAAFSIEGGHLVARLSGLYYVMLTRANTALRIAHGDLSTRTITNSSAAFTETFDDVTSIAVDDSSTACSRSTRSLRDSRFSCTTAALRDSSWTSTTPSRTEADERGVDDHCPVIRSDSAQTVVQQPNCCPKQPWSTQQSLSPQLLSPVNRSSHLFLVSPQLFLSWIV